MEENWNGKRVVVIGGTGFIGSHLTRALIELKAQVTITSRAGNNTWRLADCTGLYEHVPLDVINHSAVTNFLTQRRPEYVFYFAAVLPGSTPQTDNFEAINADGFRNVLLGLGSELPLSVVLMGTASEYGPIEIPTTENMQEKPEEPYGISKLHATEYARAIGSERGIRTTILRSPATYGPYEGFATFIPQCILACLERRTFEMSGEQEMDFLFINDLVTALLSAGMRDTGNTVEVVNISNGIPTQLASVATTIATTLNAQEFLKIGAISLRPFERRVRFLSIEKAKRLLGWEPKTSLVESIIETANWYRAHPELIPLLKQRAP